MLKSSFQNNPNKTDQSLVMALRISGQSSVTRGKSSVDTGGEFFMMRPSRSQM